VSWHLWVIDADGSDQRQLATDLADILLVLRQKTSAHDRSLTNRPGELARIAEVKAQLE